MPRFTVLFHCLPAQTDRADHWDLLLQTGSTLRTWALAAEPGRGPIEAEQLPDHRPMYLDYEGPVAGDRGTVRQWDTGHYTVLAEEETRLRFQLVGQRLRGTAVLQRESPTAQRWNFSLERE